MGFSTQSTIPAPNPNNKLHYEIQAKTMILVNPQDQSLKD